MDDIITPELVLDETTIYIPVDNTLPEESLLKLAGDLIAVHGNTMDKLGKIKCEFLKLVAGINRATSSINPSGVKSEKLGDHSITYGGVNGATADWDAYLKQVNDFLCPLFGVPSKYAGGITIHSSPKKPIIRNGCGCR